MIHLNLSVATTLKLIATGGVAATFYIQPYRPMMFVGASMEPTYHNHTFCLTEPVVSEDLKKGDVVVIDMKGGPIVKRIAFLAGDKITQVFLDHRWIDLVYVHPGTPLRQSVLKFREFVVPYGKAYVLGDNQEVSYDSKYFGCIPTSDITRRLVDQRPFNMFVRHPYVNVD